MRARVRVRERERERKGNEGRKHGTQNTWRGIIMQIVV